MYKNIHAGIIVLMGLAFSFSSCKKYLDQVPDDRITIEEIFRKKGTAEQYLANVYNYIPDESNQWESNGWLGTSDEVDVTFSGSRNYDINVGNFNPSTVHFDKWEHYYNGIRSATYFINNIEKNDEIRQLNGPELITQYQAEARFLRAYFYFMLMRQYGPVVILGEESIPPDATAEQMQFPRSPFDSCVDYVASELDKVAQILPLVPQRNGQPSDLEYGRATKGMALAVKARMLLYAASPQYNGNTDVAGFKNAQGQPLISQTYNREKWKRAADAAKAVIDLNLYTLYKDPGGNLQKTLEGIYFQAWNSEQIFVRKANDLPNWDVHCTPRQGGGWCGIAPTQEMIDSYFMSDGRLPSESSLYNENGFTNVNGVQVYNMYINREPRFYAYVTYNNSIWQGGTMRAAAPITFFVSGPNGRNGHPTDFSKTGYLVRKNVGPSTNIGSGGNGQRQVRPFILFRMAEIYLNYAEALNEYAYGDPEALRYLNLIRERAGIPQYGTGANPLLIPANQAEMRQKIWQERKVELAYESHRWFDIRRWKIAPQVMGTMHGMDITKDGNDFYKRVPTATPHMFRFAYYWYPIHQYELDRGRQLIQNPGW